MLVWEKRCRKRGLKPVAGLDEAGRGPLAGPVVAAAVILPPVFSLSVPVRDSKRLSPSQREAAYACLVALPGISIGVGLADHEEIDRINILEATRRAMAIAVSRLDPSPVFLLIDGLRLPALDLPQEKIIRGEDASLSIAAASIVAKVIRDRIMVELDAKYPEYGFVRHKGYGTPEHLERLRRHGPSPVHRRSFAPVKILTADLTNLHESLTR
jgi:ribonuclease HII